MPCHVPTFNISIPFFSTMLFCCWCSAGTLCGLELLDVRVLWTWTKEKPKYKKLCFTLTCLLDLQQQQSKGTTKYQAYSYICVITCSVFIHLCVCVLFLLSVSSTHTHGQIARQVKKQTNRKVSSNDLLRSNEPD